MQVTISNTANVIVSSPMNVGGYYLILESLSSASSAANSSDTVSGSIQTSINSFLVASLAWDSTVTQAASGSVISNPSLNWIRSVQNPDLGTSGGSGPVEIWTAQNTVGGNISITASFENRAVSKGMVMYSFVNHSLTGAAASASQQTTGSAKITTQKKNSIVVGVVCDFAGDTSTGYPTVTYTGSAVKVWDDVVFANTDYAAYHFYYSNMTPESTYTGGINSPISTGQQSIALLEIKSI